MTGKRTILDYPRNEAGLVDEFIGTAYDTVKGVYDNLDKIINVSDQIDNIDELAEAAVEEAMIPARAEIAASVAVAEDWANQAEASANRANSINTQYEFFYVAGQIQYDVVTISGVPTVNTSGMALWVEGALEYDFTINDTTKFTLNTPGAYLDGTRMRIIINGHFDDVISNLEALEDSFEDRFQDFLDASGLEVPVLYGPGISVTRNTQVFTYNGDDYRPNVEDLPFVTSNWTTDSQYMVLIGNDSLRADLIAPTGATRVGYLAPGPDSVAVTVEKKLNEVRSVVTTGAVEGGIFNCTEAFQKAGKGSYVPAGNWLVDTMVVDPVWFHGPGTLFTTGGQVIRLDNSPVTSFYRQRRMVAPLYGFDGTAGGGSLPNTEIYPGAQNAPQGLAFDRDPVTGAEYVFINQGVSGVSWSNTEHVIITKTLLRDDGASQVVETMTPSLRSTHAHLSCLRENGKLYLYQSSQTPLDAVPSDNTTTEAGKGWSKMEWKGAANVDADIVNYPVWGRPGSGHKYEHYGKGCAQVSQCGRYVVIIGINYTGSAGGRSLFVYDRKKVEEAVDPTSVMPLFAPLALKAMTNDSETAYQGETTDGRYLYICWGSGAPNARRGVTVYTLTGEKLRDIIFEGPADRYTQTQLDYGDAELGDVMSFEPEGIFLKGDAIHVTFVDYWRKGCPVVTYNGRNYVGISTTNLGEVPNMSPLRWRPTKRAATHGAWSSVVNYAVTGPMTRRDKVIYRINPATGHASEKPLVSTYMYPYSIAVNPSSASELVDVSFPLGQTWRGSAHEYATDSYRMGFGYLFSYSWDVRDVREGSDFNVRGFMRTTGIVGGDHNVQVGVGDGTATGGGNLQMFASSSASSPGSVRLTTASGVAGTDLRLMIGGITKVAVNDTETVHYQTQRPLTDLLYDLGTISRRFLGVRASRYYVEVSGVWIGSGTVSPEGAETASVGALYIHRGTGKWWRKATGTGNTGWVETTV